METAATSYAATNRLDFAAGALYDTAAEFRVMAARLLDDAEALESLAPQLGVPAPP